MTTQTVSEVTTWLSLGQAARRLAVSPQMVDVYCRAGKLTFVTTSLGRLIEPASVERLVRERAAQGKIALIINHDPQPAGTET